MRNAAHVDRGEDGGAKSPAFQQSGSVNDGRVEAHVLVHGEDDAGGLAVSMKLRGTISRLSGVEKNIDNAISFLQVQDGILSSAGKILDRMAELKALSQDVLKNDSDIANYNAEFKNLQVQLYQMSETTFNGVSLFATTYVDTSGATQNADFNTSGAGNTVSIFTSATGESGSVVSINKTALLCLLYTSPSPRDRG